MPSTATPSILSPWAVADDSEDDPLLALDLPPAEPVALRSKRTGEPVRPKFVSTVRAAALLGISIDTVRRMIKDGRLRAVKWGDASQARWRIPADEITRLGDAPPPTGEL